MMVAVCIYYWTFWVIFQWTCYDQLSYSSLYEHKHDLRIKQKKRMMGWMDVPPRHLHCFLLCVCEIASFKDTLLFVARCPCPIWPPWLTSGSPQTADRKWVSGGQRCLKSVWNIVSLAAPCRFYHFKVNNFFDSAIHLLLLHWNYFQKPDAHLKKKDECRSWPHRPNMRTIDKLEKRQFFKQ